jgi:hypothetical protein
MSYFSTNFRYQAVNGSGVLSLRHTLFHDGDLHRIRHLR